MKAISNAEHKRRVRIASYVINEEWKVGLIDSKERMRKLREVHAENGYPFSARKESACQSEHASET